ncbi:hypothetical protein [Caulobacter hibisci]|uniref:Uncharacterized protein n=1 Tax=Caulobacter hibisci TaxID=2035993 RepID=A0ABS0SZS7_9CAUL|nr:hypothetical protein [Caulobacter hibisci]MBI1685135.1 hypothetical protein [Caulobacter hibisci]
MAVPAGVAANLLLIGLLSLVERASPPVEPPVMQVELDRIEDESPHPASTPRRQKAGASPARPSVSSATSPVGEPGASEGEGPSASGVSGPAAPAIDPAWRVDPKAVERWKLTEGNPDYRWGRYHRACQGLSNEHLTDEEKDRCYGGFAAKAPSPQMGPVGRRAPPPAKFVPRGLPPPPSPFAEEARKQARCGAYRSGRASQPRLRDGIC